MRTIALALILVATGCAAQLADGEHCVSRRTKAGDWIQVGQQWFIVDKLLSDSPKACPEVNSPIRARIEPAPMGRVPPQLRAASAPT